MLIALIFVAAAKFAQGHGKAGAADAAAAGGCAALPPAPLPPPPSSLLTPHPHPLRRL